MCGINGIFAFHYAANPIDRNELVRTRDHMKARGPDGEGQWISDDGRVGFGHRRLSIIDLSSAGAQPMSNADGSLVVTFNGEIYNYRELRQRLERKGYVFQSNSDTEVLLHLYADRRAAMVHDLRGMFAFAIWDSRRREMFLARDPYGIKPLYYADDGWTFRFASQVKALTAGGAISQAIEPAGLVGFHLFGSVPEPFTLFREIRALPAGSTMVVRPIGVIEPQHYQPVAQVLFDAERAPRQSQPPDRTQGELRGALLDSVRHHLIADVPVGAFLSSGIDSSSLVGLMRDAGQADLQTVTITFDEFRGKADDEAPLAAEVARLYETRHTTRVVGSEEFQADLPQILNAMDQPSIDGINSWFVSKAAKELGLKVAISGVGGDELFGGYPSFRDVPRWVDLLRRPSSIPFLGRSARAFSRPLLRAMGANPKSAGLLELGGTYAGAYLLRRGLYMPWELSRILDRDMVVEGMRRLAPLDLIDKELEPCPDRPSARVTALESALYMKNQLLRDTDWAGMAHSIEVRTPLVDSTLLSRVAAAAANANAPVTKMHLANAPSKRLPQSVIHRAKTGFTTPIADWQRRSYIAVQPADVQQPSQPWARQWARSVMAAPR